MSSRLCYLAVCLLMATQAANGFTKEELAGIPENVRFAANIENNFIAGGFRTVLNWTSRTLGRDESRLLHTCTKPAYEGEQLCMKVPMPTPWSASVDPEAPLPEYPRPQLFRDVWLNLNGIWEFKSRGINKMGGSWDEERAQRIVVPFPVEAPLSGIANHDVNNVEMEYKRNFSVPSAWKGQRVLLHFDAVDHTATVYVNGHKLGTHEGGYDRFSFDVTEHLQEGTNLLMVHAFDPTEFAHIPIGKQRLHPPRHPSGIWYTSSSGIWQTVWLEPVPAAYIERLELIPDIDAKILSVTAHGNSAAQGGAVKAIVTAQDKTVASGEGTVGKAFRIDIPDPKLWAPGSPFLYGLNVILQAATLSQKGVNGKNLSASASAGKVHPDLTRAFSGRALTGVDTFLEGFLSDGQSEKARAEAGDHVASYFAMRKSSMGKTPDGGLRPMLNNEFVFQTGMLDQGFWPDGLYTPATDAALVFDLEFTKELGFNMLRKHTKVESDRWYYHADRLGVLVWQDMPAMFYQAGPQDLSLRDKMQFKTELQRLIQQHFNHPCIVTWVIFNEGWGQHDTLEVVKFAQDLDATRIFDAASGWVDQPAGDLIDMHNYVGPGSPVPTDTRGAVLGEFGGLGLRVEGHMWIPDDAFAYEMQLTGRQLEERYVGLVDRLTNLMLDPKFRMSAAVYTEIADVEAEINGFITYDRAVKKVDPKVLYEANQQLIARSMGKGANVTASGSRPRMSKVGKVKPKKGSAKNKAKIFGPAKPAL